MIIFKKTTFLLILLCMLSGIKAQDNIIDQVVWVVGDEAILKSDIEGVRLQMQLEKEQLDGDPYCIIPEQLAVQKLFLHQAKIDSITVASSIITRTVDRRINNAISSLGSKEKLEEYLGKSVAQLREEWREQTKDNETIKEVQQKIIGTVKLTPSEIRNSYAKFPKDSLPYIPTTVEVQIITATPKIPLTEIDAVKNKLRDFTERINKNETNFATLALLYSEDAGSAKKGGELGFMGRAELVPSFANTAFALKDPNKVSNIVESEYGFHILQLIERRGDRVNVRHILLKPKVSSEELSATMARLDSIGDDIRNSKFTFEDAAFMLSSDKETKNNKGVMVNQNPNSNYAGTARFEMKDLPQEASNVISTMNVGEVSKAFTMLDNKGKEVVAIIKLRDRIDAHRANLSDDYQIMKSIAESNKKEGILKKWVQDKIKSTYVRINDDWKNCDFKYAGWVK